MRQKTQREGIPAPAGALCTALFLICCASLSAGCVSASVSQSVQDWNAWSDLQQKFSVQADETLTTLDSHHAIFNAAIISGDPDFASLRREFASDRENLDLWKPQLMALDDAAGRFFANASLLNGTAYEAAQGINDNTYIYLANMNAARSELTSYCTNLDAYLAEGDLDYADDAKRSAADASRERALVFLKRADDALAALDAGAAALEQAQTVI